jgi:hypothetical protein
MKNIKEREPASGIARPSPSLARLEANEVVAEFQKILRPAPFRFRRKEDL